MTAGKLTCVVPRDVRSLYAAGNWKDIIAINRLLESMGVEVAEIAQAAGEVDEVLAACANGTTDLLMHYTFWPELLQAVRAAHPKVRLHTRIHNAEALQHLHRKAPGFWPNKTNLRGWYGALNLFLRDSRCRRLSDSLLCISGWDRRHYQRYLFGSGALIDLPYHCPWPDLRPQVRPMRWAERRNAVVCLAGGRDRIGASQRDGLVTFASGVHADASANEWSFEISSGVHRNAIDDTELGAVTLIGEVSEPWDLLCSVKALALLTPLGFGCKTTIIDALAAGCHVLVDHRLAARLDNDVAAHCIAVDMTSPATFERAMQAISVEPSGNDINTQMAHRARSGLATALRLSPSPQQ